MDEKTEELRNIFLDVAEEDTVTESQAATRGTLTDSDESVEEGLRDVVARMRDRFDFETDLAEETYARIVRAFYDGQDDATIADDVGLDAETVFLARTDLHLLGDGDADDVDLDTLRETIESTDTDEDAVAEATAAHDWEESAVRRALRVLAARAASRRVSQRFRSEFEDVLTDADLAVRLTTEAREDGLSEATEDAEVDVDF